MPITKETISHLPDLTDRLEGVGVVYGGCIPGALEIGKAEDLPVVEIAEVKVCTARGYNDRRFYDRTMLYYVAGVCRGKFLVVADSKIAEDNTLCVPTLRDFLDFDTYKRLKLEDRT